MAKLATTEQTITQRLTIEFLHRSDVIVVQFKVALVAPVERGHERRAGIRVREAQRVAELVGCYLEQVHACKKTGRELRRRRQNGERIEEKTTKRGENSESGMIFLCNVPGEDDKTTREFTERIHREV